MRKLYLDYKAIKAKFSCIDVARDMFGLRLTQTGRDEWRGVSPAPGEHKTDNAFSVSREEWHDFSAGVGGDVLSLVAWLKFNDIKNVKAAAKFLAGDDNFDSGYWQKYTQQRDQLKAMVEAAHEELLTDAQTLDYIHSRRINNETIERFRLGVGNEWVSANNLPVQDCRLEKMFVLIGDGQNGKGTYLKVLEALFTSDTDSGGFSQSVTNIQPKDFESPTQRILLEGSMLNIAHDIDPKLKDCASYLKSITSGDTIDGNRKFCDSHSFRPRTKIVCSSNHMLKVNDDSYGMRRRLMFCKFAACFKENADVHLLDKLLDELPGIFNRAFRAYKALLEREAIRPSIDQAEFLEEFTEIANPVAAFWHKHGEGYLARREVSKSKVFDDFREFCERNSLYAGAENSFHAGLLKVLAEAGINVTVTRHREQGQQTRYYVFISQQVKSEAERVFDAIENGTEPLELSDNDA